MNLVIDVKQLSKSFAIGPQKVQVLDRVDFQVEKGQRVAVVGNSGSGKSTLLNLLGGLDEPDSGSIVINNHDISKMKPREIDAFRNAELGYVYQFHHLLPDFTAVENAALPLMIAGLARKSALQQAAEVLAKVGLSERLNHRPAELSGGERQRVAIARALVAKPACVLMDEPTGNLDEETAGQVQQLILDLNRDFSCSFVLVTHDMEIASTMDSIYRLNKGVLNRC